MFVSFAYLAFLAVLRLLVGRPAQRVRQGHRTAGSAPSAWGASSATAAPVGSSGRSCLPCGAHAGAPVWASAGAVRGAADAAALAQGARTAEMGAADANFGPSTGLSSCAGARSEHHPAAALGGGTEAGTAAHRAELAGVPPPARRDHARLRLLHRRDAHPPPLLRALLHRAGKPPRAPRTRPGAGSPSRHETSASPGYSSGHGS